MSDAAAQPREDIIRVAGQLHPLLDEGAKTGFQGTLFDLSLGILPGRNELILTLDGTVSSAEFLKPHSQGFYARLFKKEPEEGWFEVYVTYFAVELKFEGLVLQRAADVSLNHDITDVIVQDREIEYARSFERKRSATSLTPEVSLSGSGPTGKLGLSLALGADNLRKSDLAISTKERVLNFKPDPYRLSGGGRGWRFQSRLVETDVDLNAHLDDPRVDTAGLSGSFFDEALILLHVKDQVLRLEMKARPHAKRGIRVRELDSSFPDDMGPQKRALLLKVLEEKLQKRFIKEGFLTIEWDGSWEDICQRDAAPPGMST